ncbi:hypothetical protein J2795_002914 [Chryseobacterium bernardetii]|uniref:Lipoprotein n=2 Tax=Chryseobacterium TaxID=59732 RepID=A0A543EBV1_9FLAO|nr:MULTISPECIES: hypothetical protein [Chryseobacterium]MDR6371299.1 hypothetical protein [Chryseobacterium vietnamense]MDR6442196.1 hypothetical protein [Chryseobacterium bernardetii]TQM19074.1 hypothetical protein FB551_3469 [Chryseobacterium aquifrigidense]
MNNLKLIIPIVSFLLICSCSINERPQFSYRSDRKHKGNEKDFYTKRFKDAVFYKCLQHGYGKDINFKIGKLMAEKDLFTPSDEPFITEDTIQNSLAKQIISNLPPVYMLHENENEIKGKNFIISTCLSFYESKELNKIVQKYYKRKVKENKKLEY